MGFYDIGEPRGNSLHPGSPDYDSRHADACADEAIEGDLSLKHAPCELLRALADHLDSRNDNDAAAVRELLLPLYAAKPSAVLAALHGWFSKSDAAADVAALAIEREYQE